MSPSAEEAFDPEALLEVLSRNGVEFVIIGGVGVALHGSALVTQDLDICPSSGLENLARLAAALTEVDAYQFHQPEVWVPLTGAALAMRKVAEWGTVFGKLDVLLSPAGAPDYDHLAARAPTMKVGAHQVKVAVVDDLIAMKRASGRAKDERALLDLLEIKALDERSTPGDDHEIGD